MDEDIWNEMDRNQTEHKQNRQKHVQHTQYHTQKQKRKRKRDTGNDTFKKNAHEHIQTTINQNEKL